MTSAYPHHNPGGDYPPIVGAQQGLERDVVVVG